LFIVNTPEYKEFIVTIQVELIDGCCVRVVPRGLNLLLERNLVRRFLRSSGWAVVGIDPLRSNSRSSNFSGNDRRHRSF
jgi:hypothetical protein